LYEIQSVAEKPTPSEAELSLLISGLRSGFYLCFFGIHVLTPLVFDVLEERARPGELLGLSPTLNELARRERYLALEVTGYRYNIGEKYGLLTAQLALALDGVDREIVLAQIVDLLAQRVSGGRS
jgi:UTP--glucose-1-phosphate uridylyltransferase